MIKRIDELTNKNYLVGTNGEKYYFYEIKDGYIYFRSKTKNEGGLLHLRMATKTEKNTDVITIVVREETNDSPNVAEKSESEPS